jgi:hypothetical protein
MCARFIVSCLKLPTEMTRLVRDLLGLLTYLRTSWQGLPSPGIDLAPLDPLLAVTG